MDLVHVERGAAPRGMGDSVWEWRGGEGRGGGTKGVECSILTYDSAQCSSTVLCTAADRQILAVPKCSASCSTVYTRTDSGQYCPVPGDLSDTSSAAPGVGKSKSGHCITNPSAERPPPQPCGKAHSRNPPLPPSLPPPPSTLKNHRAQRKESARSGEGTPCFSSAR